MDEWNTRHLPTSRGKLPVHFRFSRDFVVKYANKAQIFLLIHSLMREQIRWLATALYLCGQSKGIKDSPIFIRVRWDLGLLTLRRVHLGGKWRVTPTFKGGQKTFSSLKLASSHLSLEQRGALLEVYKITWKCFQGQSPKGQNEGRWF